MRKIFQMAGIVVFLCLLSSVSVFGSTDLSSEEGVLWYSTEHRVGKLTPDGKKIFEVGSNYYEPTSLAVNKTDETFWVVDRRGTQLSKLSKDTSELFRIDGFGYIRSISVNPMDGTLWVADYGKKEILKLSPDGKIILRIDGLGRPYSVCVNPTDGTLWAGLYRKVMKFSSEGKELSRTKVYKSPHQVVVDPRDGSCWASVVRSLWYDTDIIKFDPNGKKTFRAYYRNIRSLSLNPKDGSIWIVSAYSDFELRKLAADGTELLGINLLHELYAVAVDPTDGTCWVAPGYDSIEDAPPGMNERSEGPKNIDDLDVVAQAEMDLTDENIDLSLLASRKVSHKKNRLEVPHPIVKISEDGKELFKINDFGGIWNPLGFAVNPVDGTCWMADDYSHNIVKYSKDGKVLNKIDSPFTSPQDLSVNHADGTCWVADSGNSRVTKLSPMGKVLLKLDIFDRCSSVSVNSADGSVWVADKSGAVKVSADGVELARYACRQLSDVSTNYLDGTCWVSVPDIRDDRVCKLSSAGKELFCIKIPEGIAGIEMNPVDGCCWVGTRYGGILKFGPDGTKVFGTGGFPDGYKYVYSKNKNGSCLVLTEDKTGRYLHYISADGSQVLHDTTKYDSLWGITQNPMDGSFWVPNNEGKSLLKFTDFNQPAFEVQTGGKYHSIAVNPGFFRPYLPAIFQNSETTPLDITGHNMVIDGRVHSHSDILIKGPGNRITQEVSSLKKVSIIGTGTDIPYTASNADSQSMPEFQIDSYRQRADHIHKKGWVVEQGGVVEKGIHFVEGDCYIRRKDINTTATIVATGTIKIIGRNNTITSADEVDNMLFYGQKGIELRGRLQSFKGVIYAPKGPLTLIGRRQTIIGSLIGDTVSLAGNRKTVHSSLNDNIDFGSLFDASVDEE